MIDSKIVPIPNKFATWHHGFLVPVRFLVPMLEHGNEMLLLTVSSTPPPHIGGPIQSLFSLI